MVVELGEGQYPPENETCYMVLRDPTGRFYVSDSSMGFRRSEWAAHYPICEEERASTIDRAGPAPPRRPDRLAAISYDRFGLLASVWSRHAEGS